jgi:hypothetical protein
MYFGRRYIVALIESESTETWPGPSKGPNKWLATISSLMANDYDKNLIGMNTVEITITNYLDDKCTILTVNTRVKEKMSGNHYVALITT